MLKFIIVLYLVVASGGIYLMIKLFSKTRPKLLVGIIHGLLGLFGISFLIIYTSFRGDGDTPVVSILLFVAAFFLGGGMFVQSVQDKKFPKVIALIHAAIALTGIYFLLNFFFVN